MPTFDAGKSETSDSPLRRLSGRAAARQAARDRDGVGTIEELLAELRAPAPCDDCWHRKRCAEGMACEAFASFLIGRSQARWAATPRQPTAAIYAELFEQPRRWAA